MHGAIALKMRYKSRSNCVVPKWMVKDLMGVGQRTPPLPQGAHAVRLHKEYGSHQSYGAEKRAWHGSVGPTECRRTLPVRLRVFLAASVGILGDDAILYG